MSINKSTQHKSSTSFPPRIINVQKFAESRASEVEALHSIVANRLDSDFRSQRNKRRRTTGHENRGAKNRSRKKQKVSVKDESKDKTPDINKKIPRYIRRKIELKKNPESGFCTSGDGTKRLRTHVWYAKRFTMTKSWGFHLPLGLHGSGKGSRAVLKWLKHGTIVHDSSYTSAVQLEGSEELLLSILGSVMMPAPSASSDDFLKKVPSGAIYGKAMLHQVGESFSHIIAPVNYMWRPLDDQYTSCDDLHGHKIDDSDDPMRIDGSDDPIKIDGSSSTRHVWIWIHAAAFSEGYDTLKSACQMHMAEDGKFANCVSLEGELAKLEIMGSKSYELLKKILKPVTSADNAPLFDNQDQFSSSSVISLTVKDPRIKDEDAKNPKEKSDSLDLWDVVKGICPPIEEHVLCMEKHKKRLSFFFIADKKTGEANDLTKGQFSKLCPILLLRNNDLGDSITSWSVILPLSWVKAFWIPITNNGAHAIGLREKHWISCEAGLPYFPSDFPDCKANFNFMVNLEAASDEKSKLRPPSMRAIRVPVQLPWDCVRYTLEELLLCPKNTVDDKNALGDCDVPFEGFVARTSYLLSNFLSNINGDHLLLFPNTDNETKSISKYTEDGEIPNRGPRGPILNYGKKLCFVRVVLHAYKEGSFEDGAVICAPCSTDILLCTSRSDNNESELQIPQISLESYFVQKSLSSGKWEIQEPENPKSKESHRWPIGFVTTGFVRGSKKPSAVGLCEAVLLGNLREEQWKNVTVKKRKKEVYVLVRNLRSTAYRLARATILLEHQHHDVDFL